MKQTTDLSSIFLPKEISEHFDIVRIEQLDYRYDIYLDEREYPPVHGSISKGFREARTIQDFPLRGKAVFLHVRRRKWQLPDGRIYSTSYDLTHLGTQITKEFAAFLKGLH